MELFNKIEEASHYLQTTLDLKTIDIGIILGTGLTSLPSALSNTQKIEYQSIPHCPTSTVEGHKNHCIYGEWHGKKVLCFAGRFHYYEGYNATEISFPVRLIKSLSASALCLSNAAGGLNLAHNEGDIVFIKDHINFMPFNPLRGANDLRLGVRFPDMSEAYNKSLLSIAKQACSLTQTHYLEGVYLGLQGPSLETPAEYTCFKNMGADLIGMSTVPEVIVAKHSELPVLAMSIVTNVFNPENVKTTSLESVIEVVQKAETKCLHLMSEIIKQIPTRH